MIKNKSVDNITIRQRYEGQYKDKRESSLLRNTKETIET
jgi:hypothetical protein